MMYRITATYEKEVKKGINESGQIPTFFLDSDKQGIIDSNHACLIAGNMFRTIAAKNSQVHIIAYDENDDYYTADFKF